MWLRDSAKEVPPQLGIYPLLILSRAVPDMNQGYTVVSLFQATILAQGILLHISPLTSVCNNYMDI